MASRRGAGEGTIYKRADGRWAASLVVEYGRRKYFYGQTRTEVAGKLNKALRDRELGTLARPSSLTVGGYLDQWMESAQKTGVRHTTYSLRSWHVRMIQEGIGRIKLNQLRAHQIQHWYGELLDHYSPASIHGFHATLSSALEQAIKWSLLQTNPARAATPPRIQKSPHNVLSQEELGRLLEATRGTRTHALWAILGTAGLRIGEALALTWADLTNDGRVRVNKTIYRLQGGGTRIAQQPKTQKSIRTLSLSTLTLEALAAHRAIQAQERLLAGPDWSKTDLIFANTTGGIMNRDFAGQSLTRDLREAGLKHITPHDLRHTCATLHFQQGTHPGIVKELLGHANIGITMDTYSHWIPSMGDAAARTMDQILGATRKKA